METAVAAVAQLENVLAGTDSMKSNTKKSSASMNSNSTKKKHKLYGMILAQVDDLNKVCIPWQNQSGFWWNESCAMVLEVFGLPGERYTSHPTLENMDFYFANEKDAQLCRILLSERI